MMGMKTGKSRGPDGFTTDFFQYCWEIIKLDVWEVVESSRKSRSILLAINSTFLTLIPKTDKPVEPSNFIPISLYNVIYKIISKIIALKLKPISL